MNRFYVVIFLSTLLIQSSQAADVSANISLRYENETNQINIAPRRRVRIITSLEVSSDLNANWSFTAQARTGLKNKQNVPAITLHQITNEPDADKDVFLSRSYAKGTFNKLTLFAGKIPWKTQQVTDLFWD
jgi:hypothetical protein